MSDDETRALISGAVKGLGLVWTPPQPDPDQRFKDEARRLAADASYEALAGGGGQGREIYLPRTASWEELRAADEAAAKAKRDGEAEAQAAAKAEADARAGIAASDAKIKALEKEIREAESRARNRQLDDAGRAIAADRARAGKRPLDRSELRSRAARALAKVGK